MTNLRAILIVCTLGALAGACGDSSRGVTTPAAPNLNGSIFGSGHRAESDSTPGNTTAAPSSTETAAGDTTTQRNGSIFGSGH